MLYIYNEIEGFILSNVNILFTTFLKIESLLNV